LGVGLATTHQVEVVSFLGASMALVNNGAQDVDTDVVCRLPSDDLHGPLATRQRILAILGSLSDCAPLERFLPEIDAENNRSARPGPRRRSAWATTLPASLELAWGGRCRPDPEGKRSYRSICDQRMPTP
jgi:hypothetical protein